MTATVRVTRASVAAPDAYDRHPAVVSVDGTERGLVEPGQSGDFDVTPGEHEIGIRLQHNFGTASITVTVTAGGTTTVTCEKAHDARNQLLHPSQYWRLTETP